MPETKPTQPMTEAEADARMEAEGEALNQGFLEGLRRIKEAKAEAPKGE